MAKPIDQFGDNIARVKNLVGMFSALSTTTTGALDVSDILRAALVLAVSAFDHYVHEIVRLGMLDAHAGQRPRTKAFDNFRISMDSVFTALTPGGGSDWLESEIRIQHGFRAFQKSDKVAEAISLMSAISLWEEIGRRQGKPARDVRDQLDLIVDRRNKIAHEADTDPTSPGSRWPIDEPLVTGAVGFLDGLARTVDAVLL